MKEISCFSQKELIANDFPQLNDLLIPHFGWLRKLKFENTAKVTLCQLGLSLKSVYLLVFHMKRVPFFRGLIPLVTQEAETRL